MAPLLEVIDLTTISSDTGSDTGIMSSALSAASHEQTPELAVATTGNAGHAGNAFLSKQTRTHQSSFPMDRDSNAYNAPSPSATVPLANNNNASAHPQPHASAHPTLDSSSPSLSPLASGSFRESAVEGESEDAKFQNHILNTADSPLTPIDALQSYDTDDDPTYAARDPTPEPKPLSAIPDSTETSPMPQQRHTPKRMAWTTEKIAQQLSDFAKRLGNDHRMMYYRTIQDHKHKCPPDTRTPSGRDRFEGLKLEPTEEVKGLTVRAKFKHHSASRRSQSSQVKRDFHFSTVCLRTNQQRVPPYRFHHIDIPKSVLTPQTMLRFVPHIRDLESSEERKYNVWLQELEEMDEQSGFKPQSREQKYANTLRSERAARLAAILPLWLEKLAIDGCTKSTLIHHMVSQDQHDTITPQQKSTILNTYSQDKQVGSPYASRIAKMFTDAFDSVFNVREAHVNPVTLRDVLMLDESVDSIMESKKLTKDIAAPQDRTGEDELEEVLETHTLLSCLVCFSHSCDHGEYDVKNQKRHFSMEEGCVANILNRRPKVPLDALSRRACGPECFRVFNASFGMDTSRPWTAADITLLRTLICTMPLKPGQRPPQCTVSQLMGRPCWDVYRQANSNKMLPEAVDSSLEEEKPVIKNLPWYDRFKKVLIGDWQEHTKTHEHQRRELLDPCSHEGPCTKKCPCVQAGILCERFCRCTAETCAYKFTGCACHSQGKTCHSKQKERPCICVQLNRECDPGLCQSCGAFDRADASRAADDPILQTGCQNCALQRGKAKTVLLGKSQLEGVGYGLFTAEDIAQDELVIEYVGETITHDEGVRREARRGDVFNEHSNSSYLFTLLEHEGIWVDAAVYGNLSRYINHASENDKRGCNIMPKILYVNGEWRIRFSAMRDIRAGEELFFNYGENFPNLTKKLLEDRVDQEDSPTMTKQPPSRTGGATRSRRADLGRAKRSSQQTSTQNPRQSGQPRPAAGKPVKRTREAGIRKQAPPPAVNEWSEADSLAAIDARAERKRKRRSMIEHEEEEAKEYRPRSAVAAEVAQQTADVSDSGDSVLQRQLLSGRRRKRQRRLTPDWNADADDSEQVTPTKPPQMGSKRVSRFSTAQALDDAPPPAPTHTSSASEPSIGKNAPPSTPPGGSERGSRRGRHTMVASEDEGDVPPRSRSRSSRKTRPPARYRDSGELD